MPNSAILTARPFAGTAAHAAGPEAAYGCGCAACQGLSINEPQAIIPDAGAGGTAANGKPIWSLSQVTTQLLRWQEAWPTGASIEYSFLTAMPPLSDDDYEFVPLSATEQAFTRAAFALIADIVPLTFVETPWDRASFMDSESIVFGKFSDAEDFEWGHASNGTFFLPGRDEIANSEIWLSTDAVAVRQWIYGGYNFKALVHEILHALGLPHPGAYNANGDPITYEQHAQFFQDSAQFTVMSYFDASNTGADYEWTPQEVASGIGHWNTSTGLYSPATPMVHDIAALQALYGANMNTRAGDTTYGYNSTAGRPSYDFTVANAPIFTIWDGGGIDTLDLSLSGAPATVDLNEGAYSDALAMTGNIAIAYGARIENAKGGSGADSLTGNALVNRLEGGAGDDRFFGRGGDDVLVGGEGRDVAVYDTALPSQFSWSSNLDGSWTVRDLRTGSPEGTDKLIGIEVLQFQGSEILLTSSTPADVLKQAFINVLRHDPMIPATADFYTGLTQQMAGGALSLAGAYAQLVDRADNTTSVASLSYQFFVGHAPSSGGFDFLVSPTGPNPNNLNAAYYQSFSIENRFINFAVNLGVVGEGGAAFQAEYGAKTLFEATRSAYAEIFGSSPTDAKVSELLNATVVSNGQTMTRKDYMAYYGGDGLEGLGTKAAVVGWLLAVAAIEDVGVYALSNEAYLTDLADGAGFSVDLVGVYGRPEFAYPS